MRKKNSLKYVAVKFKLNIERKLNIQAGSQSFQVKSHENSCLMQTQQTPQDPPAQLQCNTNTSEG